MENTNTGNKEFISFDRKLRRLGLGAVDFMKTKGKQNLMIMIVIIVLSLIFTIVNSSFIGSNNLLQMSKSITPYAIMGLGVTFVIATGGIDLSIGTVCIASAEIAATICNINSGNTANLWLAIPLMILIGTAFGFLNGFLVAKLKLAPFIATLGTMMFSRGLGALIFNKPTVYYPNSGWWRETFTNFTGFGGSFPIGIIWVIGFMLICMYLMYKNKIGRYILAIGSNEEATRLSGIDTDKYKMIAYIICGMFAGIAAIFYSSATPSLTVATGNGMELDAIAGVYIGGTSTTGGVASIFGSFLGAILLVVIRMGLNLVISTFGIDIKAAYVSFLLTGIIVVFAVLMDIIKKKNAAKVKIETPRDTLKKERKEKLDEINLEIDKLSKNKSENIKIIEEKKAVIKEIKAEYQLKIKEASNKNQA